MKMFDRLMILSAILAFNCVAATISNADPSPCNRIATAIRSKNDQMSSGIRGDLLLALASGEQPVIHLANQSKQTDRASLREWLASTFHPTIRLRKAIDGFFDDESVWLESIPGNNLHMLGQEGGSAHCELFLFLQCKKWFSLHPSRCFRCHGGWSS